LVNESEALGRKVSEAGSRTVFENEKLGLKVDDTRFETSLVAETLSDISVDAETLRLTKKVALYRKLLDVTSFWLRVNAFKSGTLDKDKDPVVESDWLCKNSEDDTSRLTECKSLELRLAEENTLELTD